MLLIEVLYSQSRYAYCFVIINHAIIRLQQHDQIRTNLQSSSASMNPSISFSLNSSRDTPKTPTPEATKGITVLPTLILITSLSVSLLLFLIHTLDLYSIDFPIPTITSALLKASSYPLLRRQIVAIRAMLTLACECIFQCNAEDYEWEGQDVDQCV